MKKVIFILTGKHVLSKGVLRSQLINYSYYLKFYFGVDCHLFLSKINYSQEWDDLASISVYKNPHQIYKYVKNHDIIYVRNIFDFVKLYFYTRLFFKHVKIICDFRGLASEESFYRNKSKFRRFILERIESFAYKNADYVSAVSNSFSEYLKQRYFEREINVIPCAIISALIKEPNKTKDQIRFVYCGGLSKWQQINWILSVYKDFEYNNERKSSLTLFTNDIDEAKLLIKQVGITNYEIDSLSQDEVIKRLSEFDFGFLLREDILLNNVASPIKFLEYISQGVIPIISKGVGDYSELVVKNKIGMLLNDDNAKLDINELDAMLNDSLIYHRLYNTSIEYSWLNVLKNFPIT